MVVRFNSLPPTFNVLENKMKMCIHWNKGQGKGVPVLSGTDCSRLSDKVTLCSTLFQAFDQMGNEWREYFLSKS